MIHNRHSVADLRFKNTFRVKLNIHQIVQKKMASPDVLTKLGFDYKDLITEFSAQSKRIKNERELKLADDERKCAERKGIDLSSKIEDLRENLQRTYREALVMKLENHDLEVDREVLQRRFFEFFWGRLLYTSKKGEGRLLS